MLEWYTMYMPISGVDIFWPGLVLIGFSVGCMADSLEWVGPGWLLPA